ACIFISLFLLAEILLLTPDYDSPIPFAVGMLCALLLAAVILNRYFWIRIFRPLLQLAGAEGVRRGRRAE
ncbi:unnamed protein product, partial [Sphacelaria rigidula]